MTFKAYPLLSVKNTKFEVWFNENIQPLLCLGVCNLFFSLSLFPDLGVYAKQPYIERAKLDEQQIKQCLLVKSRRDALWDVFRWTEEGLFFFLWWFLFYKLKKTKPNLT